MNIDDYGPIGFLIGKWSSGSEWTGENTAPDPSRGVERTRFRQEMTFETIGEVNNHEQKMYGLRYINFAWEEGDDESPFHQETGYWLWDPKSKHILKSFVIPRGVCVNAGGESSTDAQELLLQAKLGSEVYGLCSNPFLDKEFKSLQYDLKIKKINENCFEYDEDTIIQIKGVEAPFHHTEKNTLKKEI